MDSERIKNLVDKYGSRPVIPKSAKVEVYSKSDCPHCDAAKALLGELKQVVIEYDIEKYAERKSEWRRRSKGRNTVPQIFINDVHVGGNDDLQALHRAGRLQEIIDAV